MIVVSTIASNDGVIGLNGKQYLLDTDDEVMVFKNEESARAFIEEHGEDPDSEYIDYEDYVQHELDEYSDNLKKLGTIADQQLDGFDTDEELTSEDDEYAYPTTAEINDMRAEYLKEKDIQIEERVMYVDNERETLLSQADFLKTKMREDNTWVGKDV